MLLGAKLTVFVEERELGGVYGADTTYLIGANQRLPDVSFVAAARIPADGDPEGMWQLAPDLAVEVVSPNDLYEKVGDKVLEYLAAGVKQVWIVSTKQRSVTIYRSPVDVQIFSGDAELVSEDLLPGFRCRLSDIFKTPTQTQSPNL